MDNRVQSQGVTTIFEDPSLNIPSTIVEIVTTISQLADVGPKNKQITGYFPSLGCKKVWQ